MDYIYASASSCVVCMGVSQVGCLVMFGQNFGWLCGRNGIDEVFNVRDRLLICFCFVLMLNEGEVF